MGNLVSTTDPLDRTFLYSYDALRRLVTEAQDFSTNVLKTYRYDSRDHLIEVLGIDPDQGGSLPAPTLAAFQFDVAGQLTAEVDRVRDAVLEPLLAKLNGKLTAAEKASIERAFRLFQNRLLHGPIAALHEASREGHSHGLREALMKLFGLKG